MIDGNDLVTHNNNALLVANCGKIANSSSFKDSNCWKALPRELRQTSAGKMCWMANTWILPLHQIKHTQSQIDKLNEHGLYIYLYEPMCSYMEDDTRALGNGFNCGFYSEYPNEFSDWSRNRASELDSISYYAHQNNLTNVTVRTGDYNVEKYYPHYSDQLKLECNDLFLRCLTVYDHINTRVKQPSEMDTTFICTSWRYTPARNLMAAILVRRSSILTWYFQVADSVLHDTVWFELGIADPQLKKDLVLGNQILNQRSPMCLDKKTDTALYIDEAMGHFYPKNIEGFEDYANPVSINPQTLPLEKYYRRCFLDVVCESRYAQPTANISEKVFQPIQFKTPFVLVAPPHSLEYLKSMGYKTFDRWWDESYDAEENHAVRIHKIYQVLNYINDLTREQQYDMYTEMWSVLKHNFDLHLRTTPDKGLRKSAAIKWDEIQDKHWVAEEIDPVTGRPVGWE